MIPGDTSYHESAILSFHWAKIKKLSQNSLSYRDLNTLSRHEFRLCPKKDAVFWFHLEDRVPGSLKSGSALETRMHAAAVRTTAELSFAFIY